MNIVLLPFHILIAIALSAFILLQSSKGGLGTGFGGGELYHSKRGAERAIFVATISATVLFFLTSIVLLAINR